MSQDIRTLILGGKLSRRERVSIEIEGQRVEVEVRSLSVRQRQTMLAACADADGIDQPKLYAAAIIACSYKPGTDEKSFTEADRDAIMDAEGAAVTLDVLAGTALRLNGLDAQSTKDAEKN